MSSETESIVKYLFLRLLFFILAQVSPANFNPFKCLKVAGNLPPPFTNIRIQHLSCQMGHTGCEIGLCFHFQRRVVFYICGLVEYEVLVCLLLRGKHMQCIDVISWAQSQTSLHLLTKVYSSSPLMQRKEHCWSVHVLGVQWVQ